MIAFAAHVLVLTAIIWVATTALYFLGGWSILKLAERHPERKIQEKRDGALRARAEIRESLRSMGVTSLCMSIAITLTLFGYTIWTPLEGFWGFVISVVILILGYDLYYYWAHRLLHTKAFIRFHRWHHKSIAPTVWSTDSQSVVETAMIQSFMVWAAILFPIAPLAFVAHRLYDHINGQLGHCGYEFFADKTTRFPSPMVCTSYHDQHHELYSWNFGNYSSVWDRLHGTLHPSYDETVDKWAAKASEKPTPAE